MSIYFTSQKGNVRPTNEDGHTIKTCLNNEIQTKRFYSRGCWLSLTCVF
jgi:hypothetical protein